MCHALAGEVYIDADAGEASNTTASRIAMRTMDAIQGFKVLGTQKQEKALPVGTELTAVGEVVSTQPVCSLPPASPKDVDCVTGETFMHCCVCNLLKAEATTSTGRGKLQQPPQCGVDHLHTQTPLEELYLSIIAGHRSLCRWSFCCTCWQTWCDNGFGCCSCWSMDVNITFQDLSGQDYPLSFKAAAQINASLFAHSGLTPWHLATAKAA